MKAAYQVWLSLYRDFPKVERMGIGQKIEQAFLDALELTFRARYLSPVEKLPVLDRAISKLDVIKFFVQMAWENKLIPMDKYPVFLVQLGEIGRQLGAWKKGIQEKLLQLQAKAVGERK